MLPVILFSLSLKIYWHVIGYFIQCITINLLAGYWLFYSVYHYKFIGMIPITLFRVLLLTLIHKQ